MKPFKLLPAYKDYLWGGERLRTEFDRRTALKPLAESWELSCHPDGENTVESGEFTGKTLSELVKGPNGPAMLGRNCEKFSFFPILIKLIDAKKSLSIQVHPSDAYALEHEGSYGKTEMWYILDAEPDSFLYYGVQRETTEEEMRQAIRENRLEELLCKRPVKAGDVVFIPAGTLHAIGAGILLCEVQQNSNITYRVYDFGRRDTQGKLRDLHIDQALKVSSLVPTESDFRPAGQPVSFPGGTYTMLAACEYFKTGILEVGGECARAADGSSFASLLCISGEGTLSCQGEKLHMKKGSSLFVPADAGQYKLEGNFTCVLTEI